MVTGLKPKQVASGKPEKLKRRALYIYIYQPRGK